MASRRVAAVHPFCSNEWSVKSTCRVNGFKYTSGRGRTGGASLFFSRTKPVGSKISTVAAVPLSRPSSVAVWVPRVRGTHPGWHPPSTSSSVLVYVIVSTPCFNETWTMSFNIMVSKLQELITHFHYADISDEVTKCYCVSIACTKLRTSWLTQVIYFLGY
jgi:hypothetical protein